MANTTTFQFKLEDGGSTKQKLNEFKELNAEADKLKNKAGNLFNKGMGRGAVAASYKANMSDNGPDSYATARGAIGTGAAGRDFAKQSQGLGGLVHVYATFAANLFAVSAAFKALSDAADTTNMIKGLDQLGAASGTSLGKISKNLVEATDGAISLREAMTATAQASAAGMSDANIKRLGTSARAASAALGVGMGDALSRLSRGITKLEPELLDELGIFVRVDKASEDYARTVGKSAATLTDFEKRQAFANAVLDQAQKKFGAIDIPANPYDKLLSSLKNVAQTGLEVANKALGPLAEMMANSPTGLGLALAGIAAVLLKQAIPAISQFRNGLREAADQSAASVAQMKEDYAAYELFAKETAKNYMSQNARNLQKTAEAAVSQVNATFDKGLKIGKGKIYDILSKSVADISPSDIAKISKQINVFEGLSTSTKASVTDAAKSQAKVKADELRNLVPLILSAQQAQEKYNLAVEAETKGIAKTSFQGKMLQMIDAQANKAAKASSLVAQAYDDTKLIGVTKAFATLTARVAMAREELGFFGAKMVMLKGTFAIVAAGIGTVFSALGSVMSIIGLTIGAMSMLTSWLGANSKEASAAATALADLDDAGGNLSRTLDAISKKDPLEALSIESIAARTNALATMGSTMVAAIDKVDKEISSRNWVDKFTNAVSGMFGKSTEDKLSKELSATMVNVMTAAKQTIEGRAFVVDMAGILGLDAGASTKEFASALQKADVEIKKIAANKLDKFAQTVNTAAQGAKALLGSFTELYKQYDDIVKAAANETPLNRASVAAVKDLNELSKVLSGEFEPALATVSKLTQDPKFLRLFPESAVVTLTSSVSALKSIGDQYAENTQLVESYEKSLATMNEALKKPKDFIESETKNRAKGTDAPEARRAAQATIEAYKQAVPKMQEELNNLKLVTPGLQAKFKSLATQLQDAIASAVSEKIDTTFQQISTAMEKANIATQKSYLQGISGTAVGANIDAKLTQRGLDLDIANIEASKGLVTALANNTLIQQEANSLAKIELLERQRDKANLGSQAGRDQYAEATGKLGEEKAFLEKVSGLRKGSKGISGLSAEDVKKMSPDIQNTLLPMISQIGGMQANIAGLQGQKMSAEFQKNLKLLDIEQSRMSDKITKDISEIQQELDTLGQLSDPNERQAREEELTKNKKLLELQQKTLPDVYKIRAAQTTAEKMPAAAGAVTELQDVLRLKLEQAGAEMEIAEKLRLQAKLAELVNFNYAKTEHLAARQAQSIDQASRFREQQLSSELEILNINNQLGVVSANEYTNKKNILELSLDSVSAAKAEVELAERRRAAIDAINKDINLTPESDTSKKTRLADDLRATTQYFDEEARLLQRSNEGRRAAITLQQDMYGRTQGYAEVFKVGFKGMEDAIVDFTKTGKLSFKSMIDSMLEELLRYEIRQQQVMMFQSMGGARGLANMVLGAMGVTPSVGTPNSNITSVTGPGGNASGAGSMQAAKGAYFDGASSNFHKFAKGGTFTNSIVSSPTLFKFAKGTGLMGEAGPEAIMPLSRDSNGSLGVKATTSAPKVEVVVNNHSGAPATTKETIDSRGNRKIEVVVGDMVASEMSRPGSKTQSSMKNNFGIQPALVRR